MNAIFHVVVAGKRTTVSIDKILANLLSVKLVPDLNGDITGHYSVVGKWLQEQINSKQSFGGLSQFLQLQAILEIADHDLVRLLADNTISKDKKVSKVTSPVVDNKISEIKKDVDKVISKVVEHVNDNLLSIKDKKLSKVADKKVSKTLQEKLDKTLSKPLPSEKDKKISKPLPVNKDKKISKALQIHKDKLLSSPDSSDKPASVDVIDGSDLVQTRIKGI